MTQKIFDIFPPSKKREEEEITQKEAIKETIEKEEIKREEVKKKKFLAEEDFFEEEEPNQIKRGLFLLFLVLLILGTAFLYRISKVDINIWPDTESVSFEPKVTMKEGVKSVSLENKLIPAQIFELEKDFSEEFPATGKVLKKAEGIIKLYNSYTTESETWQEGTRFVSSDGKLFKSKGKVVVPGAQMKNGKIVPSSVDIQVIAAEAGSEYNIGPTSFSVVAFRGTPRYTKFYGESSQPMAGGGQAVQVTKEDIEKAESILVEKVRTESKDALKKKLPEDFIFLTDAVEINILEKSSLAEPGKEADKFIYQVKVKAKTPSFKKDDVNNFAEKFLASQIQEGKAVLNQSIKMDYSPETVNFESGNFLVDLKISAKLYPKIDLLALKSDIKGRSINEAKIFLENQQIILKTEIKPFPFWLKNIPKDIDNIVINYPLVD